MKIERVEKLPNRGTEEKTMKLDETFAKHGMFIELLKGDEKPIARIEYNNDCSEKTFSVGGKYIIDDEIGIEVRGIGPDHLTFIIGKV